MDSKGRRRQGKKQCSSMWTGNDTTDTGNGLGETSETFVPSLQEFAIRRDYPHNGGFDMALMKRYLVIEWQVRMKTLTPSDLEGLRLLIPDITDKKLLRRVV